MSHQGRLSRTGADHGLGLKSSRMNGAVRLVSVAHAWAHQRFEHAHDELILIIELDRVIFGQEADLITRDLEPSSAQFRVDRDGGYRITGVAPADVEKAVASLRKILADLPHQKTEALRRNELADQSITEAIKRGLGESASS